MIKIEELADKLEKSMLFSSDFQLVCAIRKYFDENKSSKEIVESMRYNINLLEMQGIKIDEADEEKFISEFFPEFINLINELLMNNSFDNDQLQSMKAYTEIGLPFKNLTFHLYVIKTVFLIADYLTYKNLTRLRVRTSCINELKQFYLEKDDLVDVSSFEVLNKGFLYKDKWLVVYPSISYKLRLILLPFFKNNCSNVKLCVRAGTIGKYIDYTKSDWIFEERLFGMPFSKNNLRNITSKQYGIFEYNFTSERQKQIAKSFFIPLKRLEYVIKPYDENNLTLSIEEVNDCDKDDYMKISNFKYEYNNNLFIINRYFHVIFDKQTYDINHLDLSYLHYDFDSYCQRIDNHLKDKTVPASIKIKRFRLDGKIDFDSFQSLLIASLDGDKNPEIINFLLGR